MADTQKTEQNVKIIAEFTDGTEQNITQNNPVTENLVEKINAFGNFIKSKNLIISSKSDAQFSRIKQAILHKQTETDFDLTPSS